MEEGGRRRKQKGARKQGSRQEGRKAGRKEGRNGRREEATSFQKTRGLHLEGRENEIGNLVPELMLKNCSRTIPVRSMHLVF